MVIHVLCLYTNSIVGGEAVRMKVTVPLYEQHQQNSVGGINASLFGSVENDSRDQKSVRMTEVKSTRALQMPLAGAVSYYYLTMAGVRMG